MLVLGPSTKSTLRQQIAADIRREQLGQLRASDVSQSEPEEWTAEGASMKPPTQGGRHRPLQRKDFQAAAAAVQYDYDDDDPEDGGSDSSHLLGSSIDGLSTRCEEEEEEEPEESKATTQQQHQPRTDSTLPLSEMHGV